MVKRVDKKTVEMSRNKGGSGDDHHDDDGEGSGDDDYHDEDGDEDGVYHDHHGRLFVQERFHTENT
nr:hypothetical protein [Brevibacillus laterosporus]